jgi:hypothetical protein
VAELADALRSGRSGRKAIWVQLPASALARESGLFYRYSAYPDDSIKDPRGVMSESDRLASHPSAPARRRDHEFPAATARNGWKYHHLGIPTPIIRPGEKHLRQFGMYVSGFDTSEYGIEWMRFEETSPLPELIRTVPHLAFVVEDLDAALEGREILFDVSAPSDGVRTAMIVDDGAPIELMEFRRRREPAPR